MVGSIEEPFRDTRDAVSLVCFNAMDDYHATADPYYCVKIRIRDEPEAGEEVLLRFDCKQALLWNPQVRYILHMCVPMNRDEQHVWIVLENLLSAYGGGGCYAN